MLSKELFVKLSDPFSADHSLVKSKIIVPLNAYIDYLIICEFLIQDDPMNPTTLLIRANDIRQLFYTPTVTHDNIHDVLKSYGFNRDFSSSNDVKFKLDRDKYPTVRTIRGFRQRVLGNFSM
ncbi:hypothetical protein FE392_18405 [Xenorhabdus sp. 12]|uniref:Uncharacterized protein n=1 Tax=Xenorhabdus santafensis TaxID=2582833 RepID=A0ABU4SEM2_9GAMM|nr:hypothetical protein [Xenorhabdus sp. 12]MDX7989253.1 hypothetical protein [Xenorhabdus sp. 12]